jgi:hypothetical protein
MLRGLLESAGVHAMVRDDMVSSVHPFLQPLIGGAKIAVAAGDQARAREILQAAGALPGPQGVPPAEIPEEEWSRPLADPASHDAGHAPREGRRRDARERSLGRAAVVVPLAAVLLLSAMRCASGS